VGLERGPLSIVSTTEELLGKGSGSSLEKREYCRRDAANVGTNFAVNDHSSPTTAEVKKAWIYTSTSPYVFMA
jgi:hypothetical protein